VKPTHFVFIVLSFLFGLYSPAHAGEPTAAESKLGEKVYRESCAACHGIKGDGNETEAYRLKIKPRDFTSGIYKFRSTPSGSLPLDQDILRTIARGIRGTSMLAQLHLSQAETWAVAQYLKIFSSRFREEKPNQPIVILARPATSQSLIAIGKTMFKEAGCVSCHGSDGKGNDPSTKSLKDHWGYPIQPSDLTRKPFKSGSSPEDLYRTLSTGLDGTPMPSYADLLKPKEVWALAYYVLSIAKDATRGRGMMGMMNLVGEERLGMMIDMPAAMGGMMRGRGMMGRDMQEMMKDRMGR
jgi:cytochrome c oxidase cbb3-type subunit 2